MLKHFFTRLFQNMAHHDNVIDKLAESGPIRRAAQITAYYILRLSDTAKKRMIELEKNSDSFKRIREEIEKANKKRL